MGSDYRPGRHVVRDYFLVGSSTGSIITETGSTRFGDTVDDLHQFTGSISISGSGGILILDGSAISGSGGVTAHSALTGLTGSDDHTQYLLVDGTRGMSSDLVVSGSVNVGGTVGITGSLFVAGTDISSSINAHVTNTSNPHSVAAAQVGNSVAQWNANQLQGNAVTGAAPVDGNMLYWNSGSATWDLVASSSAGITAHSALTGLTGSDDHTQYLLVDGTRGVSSAFGVSGSLTVSGSSKLGNLTTDVHQFTGSIDLTGPGGSLLIDGTPFAGDVLGPTLSVDDQIVRFDGVSGKLITGSTGLNDVSYNDAGVITANSYHARSGSQFGELITDSHQFTGSIRLSGTYGTVIIDGSQTTHISLSGLDYDSSGHVGFQRSDLSGSSNPNGSVIGYFGQAYREIVYGIWYKCISIPSGTNWGVI